TAGYVPAIWLIFKWMALVFLKTHLKDKQLFLNRDRRNGAGRISDLYDWGELHHIHCVARASYTQCELDTPVLGSVQILPAKKILGLSGFDYGDVYQAQTLFVTLDEIAIVTVLNDSCGSLQLARDRIEQVRGRVSPLQIREVMAHLACANLHLKKRPVFFSDF